VALARLAALVALGAAPGAYSRAVGSALTAGATVEDVIDTLTTVAPIVGLARVVAAAPDLAIALGYDINRALDVLDEPRAIDTTPERSEEGSSLRLADTTDDFLR
jgi:hypothetical protein